MHRCGAIFVQLRLLNISLAICCWIMAGQWSNFKSKIKWPTISNAKCFCHCADVLYFGCLSIVDCGRIASILKGFLQFPELKIGLLFPLSFPSEIYLLQKYILLLWERRLFYRRIFIFIAQGYSIVARTQDICFHVMDFADLLN